RIGWLKPWTTEGSATTGPNAAGGVGHRAVELDRQVAVAADDIHACVGGIGLPIRRNGGTSRCGGAAVGVRDRKGINTRTCLYGGGGSPVAPSILVGWGAARYYGRDASVLIARTLFVHYVQVGDAQFSWL